MKQKFTIIGLSDHPAPWLQPDILRRIQEGTVFSGGLRHHEIVKPLLPPNSIWINITVPLDDVFRQYEPHADIIVFASGDPLFFGFANTIQRKLPEAEIILFPTFNSLQQLAHRLALRYDDMRTVSLTGRPWHEFDGALIRNEKKIGVLTDREHTPATIAQRMLTYGYTNYIMYVGEHIGNPAKERIRTFSIEEAAEAHDFQHPNCIILDTRMETGQPRPNADAFEHLSGRPNMITKAPIRLLSLSALDLQHRSSFWDIGFCTGSVSIEAKLQFPHLHITAFEIRPEGATLMEANSRKFGTPGITTVIGDFLEADLSAYTAPDAVFIGGHSGKLKEIINRVQSVMSPGGVIVFNSVSEKSKSMFIEAIQQAGMELLPSTQVKIDQHNPIEIMKTRITS